MPSSDPYIREAEVALENAEANLRGGENSSPEWAQAHAELERRVFERLDIPWDPAQHFANKA